MFYKKNPFSKVTINNKLPNVEFTQHVFMQNFKCKILIIKYFQANNQTSKEIILDLERFKFIEIITLIFKERTSKVCAKYNRLSETETVCQQLIYNGLYCFVLIDDEEEDAPEGAEGGDTQSTR